MKRSKRAYVLRSPITISLPDTVISLVESLAVHYDQDRNGLIRLLLREAVEHGLARLTEKSRAEIELRAAELAKVPRRRLDKGGLRLMGEAREAAKQARLAGDGGNGTAPPRPVDDRGA